MKLLGYHNNNQVVASIAHYDFRAIDGAFADGGQFHTNKGSGYSRGSGDRIFFEVLQTFAELYNDYNQLEKPRKYGIWNLSDVRILPKKEWPKGTFEEKAENFIWGTNGPNGNLPTTYVLLKDCSFEHLENILALLETRPFTEETQKFVKYWIKQKKP